MHVLNPTSSKNEELSEYDNCRFLFSMLNIVNCCLLFIVFFIPYILQLEYQCIAMSYIIWCLNTNWLLNQCHKGCCLNTWMPVIFLDYNSSSNQKYTYRVLQSIQLKLILLWVWAERAIKKICKIVVHFFKFQVFKGYLE